MRSIIRTLGIGVASTALVLAAPSAALAGGHRGDDDGGHGGRGHHGDDNGHGHDHGDDNGHGHDHGDDNGDTTIDEIVDPGTFDKDEAETAVITIEYTCPEDADAFLSVWVKQEQDNDKSHHGKKNRKNDDKTVRGSETVWDLDCDDDEVDVEVEADDDDEWEEGDAKVKALLVSKDDGDREKDFEQEEIELEED